MSQAPDRPHETVNLWLAEFAQQEGISQLMLDERGLIGLRVDDVLEIEIEVPSEQSQIYLRAGLMPLPEQDRERWYCDLLERNFLLQETGGASFAIDAQRAQVALSFCEPLDRLDAMSFANVLRNFISAALAAHRELNLRASQDSSFERDTKPAMDLSRLA